MINKPLITIVTVTYNAEEFLERTIKSVIEQDYKNIEYIIIDGGSSDGTIDIIKKYEKYINYWVSEKDEGIYDAMNKAIDKATGEWINFMNAGDYFANKTILSKVVSLLDVDTNMIYGGINAYWKDNDRIVYEPAGLIENIFKKHPYNHQALFLSIQLAKSNKFDLQYKYASDVNQLFKIYKTNILNIKVIDMPIANFLMGGFWQQNIPFAHVEILHILSLNTDSQKHLCGHTSFHSLQNYNPIPNLYFSNLFNKLINEVEDINKKYKKIALYGYGNIAKMLLPYLKLITHCIFDKNIENKDIREGIIYDNPINIKNYEFDVIVILVLGREDEIIENISKNYHIANSKIYKINLGPK